MCVNKLAVVCGYSERPTVTRLRFSSQTCRDATVLFDTKILIDKLSVLQNEKSENIFIYIFIFKSNLK